MGTDSTWASPPHSHAPSLCASFAFRSLISAFESSSSYLGILCQQGTERACLSTQSAQVHLFQPSRAQNFRAETLGVVKRWGPELRKLLSDGWSFSLAWQQARWRGSLSSVWVRPRAFGLSSIFDSAWDTVVGLGQLRACQWKSQELGFALCWSLTACRL